MEPRPKPCILFDVVRAGEVMPGDVIFYCEKSRIDGWIIVEKIQRQDVNCWAIFGRSYPEAQPFSVAFMPSEHVGRVRGVSASDICGFEEAERLASEAQR